MKLKKKNASCYYRKCKFCISYKNLNDAVKHKQI